MNRQNDATRPLDVVLFGATGFVGTLTAEYLAAHAPVGLRWALAGRSRAKLEGLRERLTAIAPGCADLPLLETDADDTEALAELAASTRVVATTVGPYIRYGEKLVAACAEVGTDYADLTGEAEFIDRTYLEHDARARETGARIVHACGFDSVPHDLGAYFTVKQLPEDVPLTVDGFVRTDAVFSGGTFASALTAMGRGPQMLAAARERRLHEPRLVGGASALRRAPRTSAGPSAPGRSRCRRWTRRSWAAPRGPWSGTAPTSATGISPRSRPCRWPSAPRWRSVRWWPPRRWRAPGSG